MSAAYVRRLLCEFANAATKTRCGFRAKFQALVIRRGKRRDDHRRRLIRHGFLPATARSHRQLTRKTRRENPPS